MTQTTCSSWSDLQGKNRVDTTTVAPLLSRSVAQSRGHRAKKLWCIPSSWENKEEGTIGLERRVYHQNLITYDREKYKMSCISELNTVTGYRPNRPNLEFRISCRFLIFPSLRSLYVWLCVHVTRHRHKKRQESVLFHNFCLTSFLTAKFRRKKNC